MKMSYSFIAAIIVEVIYTYIYDLSCELTLFKMFPALLN